MLECYWDVGMLLGPLGASLLQNLLKVLAQLEQVKAQLELVQTQLEKARVFNTTWSFSKFRNTKILQNEPKVSGVYSRNNLPKVKDGAYIINLEDYGSIGPNWIVLYVNNKIIIIIIIIIIIVITIIIV